MLRPQNTTKIKTTLIFCGKSVVCLGIIYLITKYITCNEITMQVRIINKADIKSSVFLVL